MNGFVVVDGSEIAAFVQQMHGTAPVKRQTLIEQIVEYFLVWRFKKNGPASPASDPSRGSNNPSQDKNMDSNSTKPTDAAIASAMYELGPDLRHLLAMTEILGDMLDDYLVEYDMKTGEKIASPKNGKPLRVMLSDGEHSRLVFAWNDVIIRASRLVDAYDAALEGREDVA